MEEVGDYISIVMSQEASMINKIGVILLNNLGPLAKLLYVSFVDRQIKLKLKKDNNYLLNLENILTIINNTCSILS